MKQKILHTVVRERFLVCVLLIFLTLIPGVHKALGDFPPQWFHNLFEQSIIGKIPFGIEVSFALIMLIELGAGLLFCMSLFQKLTKQDVNDKVMELAFSLTLLLFIILFFGSFLIENYDNGFKDFVYFIGVYYLRNRMRNEINE